MPLPHAAEKARPLLANLFLHYGFDMWMRRNHPGIPFERYAEQGWTERSRAAMAFSPASETPTISQW
jgi:hypothetical protein